ncbi:hypothetical protein NAEGRDRAFT_57308 [Naegleria gruberi]|uniref:Cell division cycle protein 123 homolog n=1 Tax=Naegleria gruberi TaxID=5762 RepID=D2V6N2_NAEGR|nr:uncharacterized protein NAEGRDRAFT_57308 [Naegleria gruberi]EFC47607.1 hypothetical protein NAEGRDRAFT_57308 [Naegleria gruberi]|eukprot:XP_002680351.1 hypothetical protein NAEGRDRAFT_57308 [Naegleria gruberi strain NEG-M]
MTEPKDLSNPSERYGFEYDIDAWYEKCSKFTTYTKFIPITQSEAKVMIKQYEFHIKKTKDQSPSGDDYEILKKLEGKIDDELTNNSEFYDEEMDVSSAFIRLSSRSPKDAAFNSQKIRQILQRKLYEKNAMFSFGGENAKIQSDQDKQNNEFIAFFESQVEVMKFESGQEAIEMMTSSTRVYDDLNIALKYRNDDSLWNVFFVLRKWIPNHNIQYEFRTFVYNRKLCAISQYNDALFFEDLCNHKDLYLKAMLNFFEKIKDEIPFDNSVMDLVIYPLSSDEEKLHDMDNLNVQVLEFNPFNQYTGSAFFSWIKDTEILKGEKPFEFRIREDSLPVLRNIDFSESGSTNKNNQLMFNLMDIPDQSIIEENSELLEMVDDFLNNDLERIHSNFKYVVQKTTTESASERLNAMGI